MQVTDLVRAGQQVPGHVAQPGGGVDQVGGAAKRGDLCQDAVDGRLQSDLQVAEVPCRGEGPGVLEGEDLRVVPVEAGVLEGLSGLVGRLGEVCQERRGHPLVHVGRGLPGSQVDGQLVHHALQRVGGRHSCEGGVAARGDAGVHRCYRRVVRQLKVHGGRRGLLPSTWTCRASRADWLAFEARPRVRLVLTAVRPEALAATSPSAAARSAARA